MKKVLLTMLTLLTASSMWAQTTGSLNVPTVNRKVGAVNQAIIVKKSASREGVVKIQLANSASYRDMQFDLTLPEGISLVTEPTTENPVVKVDAINDEHHVLFYALDGQTVKIAVVDNVVNLPATTETASAEDYGKYLADGIVFELPIQAAADFTDVKNANIANLAFTDDAAAADINAAAATFGIAMIQLGDVDDDGDVTLNDAIFIARFTVEGNPQPFVEVVADYDGQDGIALNDAIEVARSTVTDDGSASSKQILDVEDSFVNEMDPE